MNRVFALFVLFVSAVFVSAQAPSTEPAKSDPAANAKAEAGVTLNNDSLLAMLQSIGYDVKMIDNKGLYRLKVNTDINNSPWTFEIDISLSPSGRKVWLQSTLAKLPDDLSTHSARLVKIMNKQLEIGPAHIRSFNNMLDIAQAFDNSNVNAVKMRFEIDNFMRNIRLSESVWNTKHWEAKEQPKSPPQEK